MTPKNLMISMSMLVLAVFAATFAGGLAPEPSAVPKRWQLQVEFGPLRVFSDSSGGTARTYFYQTYKAVNRSGQDVVFAPSFDLIDASGSVSKSGRSVPEGVTKALLARSGNPLMQDQIAIMGTMLQGEENAKEGLVVWTCENLRPGAITVFASGFAGETAQVKVPGAKDEKGNDLMVTLRKTRQMSFANPGDLVGRGDLPLEMVEGRWIMR